jgi:hypothetical protein
MNNVEAKKQIIDLVMNIVFIFDLQISNNYKSVKVGM